MHLLLTAIKGMSRNRNCWREQRAEKVKAYGMSREYGGSPQCGKLCAGALEVLMRRKCKSLQTLAKSRRSETFEIERLFFIYGRLFVLGIFFIEELFHVFDGLALFAGQSGSLIGERCEIRCLLRKQDFASWEAVWTLCVSPLAQSCTQMYSEEHNLGELATLVQILVEIIIIIICIGRFLFQLRVFLLQGKKKNPSWVPLLGKSAEICQIF